MQSDKEDQVPFAPPMRIRSTNDLSPAPDPFPKPLSRHEKFHYEKYLKKPKDIDRSDPFFQKSLRRKFVETAKKYLGTPYNKKSPSPPLSLIPNRYLQPGDPHYDSPLYR